MIMSISGFTLRNTWRILPTVKLSSNLIPEIFEQKQPTNLVLITKKELLHDTPGIILISYLTVSVYRADLVTHVSYYSRHDIVQRVTL